MTMPVRELLRESGELLASIYVRMRQILSAVADHVMGAGQEDGYIA